jgi:hypothetical protein
MFVPAFTGNRYSRSCLDRPSALDGRVRPPLIETSTRKIKRRRMFL